MKAEAGELRKGRNCVVCGRLFVSGFSSDVCSLAKCKSAYQKAYIKAYQKAYHKSDKYKAYQKAYHKDNYVWGTIAGKPFRVFTDGATEEMRKQLPRIKKRVLDDCIKNPRKYL